ncbi:MAG TPA: hypothetical protein VMW02_03655 [Thermoplasmata archaeon]|nr:hypothetical protein [Thermoplasmata archaeon]
MRGLDSILSPLLQSKGKPRGDEDSALDGIRALALINVMLRAQLPFHRAIASARSIAKGRMREALDGALRRTLLGASSSLERALEEELRNLPRRLRWISISLREYMLCNSEPENDQREEHLDRAFGSALESCRQALKETVSGLRVPVSAIFALGIVLPIVIATMVPLWGMASSEALTHGFGSSLDAKASGSDGGGLSFLIAAPILAFPALCLLSSLFMLRGKEFVSDSASKAPEVKILAFFCALGAVTLLILFLLDIDIPPLVFIALILPCAYFVNRGLRSDESAARQESIYARPSVLNEISAMLGSGEHLVRAVAKASPDSKEAADAFWLYALPRTQETGHDSEFDDEMIMLISESSKRDPRLAANVLRQVSRHLSDLSAIEAEIRFELKPIAQSVLVTTIVLAPFVLGIAGGFGSFGSLAGKGSVSFSSLTDLFAAFIAEMAIVGLWLVRRINPGDGSFKKITDRPTLALAASMGTFLLSLWISAAMFA